MDPQVFFQVVLPLLLIDDTALLCISTISGDQDNFYSELMDLTSDETGEALIKQHRFYLSCKSCLAQGLGNSCEHMDERRPAWHSSESHELVRKMYGAQKTLHEAEAKGIRAEPDGQCFAIQDIQRAWLNPRKVLTDYPVKKLYIAIDPNSGTEDSRKTTGSDFAMVSGYFEEYTMEFVLCGLESIDAKNPRDYEDRVINHIKQLRQQPCFRNSLIVCVFENNLGQEAGHLHNLINRNFGENMVVLQHQLLKSGVGTTNGVKKSMMQQVRRMFMNNQIWFAEESSMVCTGKLNDKVENMGTLKQQFQVYTEIIDSPNTPLGRVRKGYSGKGTMGRKDDMCVAFQLLVYWSNWFMTSMKYARYH
ncbi:MAG: hypothetical protein ACTSUE_01980 [Promethearchaeota archaeon]